MKEFDIKILDDPYLPFATSYVIFNKYGATVAICPEKSTATLIVELLERGYNED